MNIPKHQTGFTIVELLIVVIVIAILATITIVSFSNISERARNSKVSNDIATILKAINTARSIESKNLATITNSTATGSTCWNAPSGTDLAQVAKTHTCWTTYYTTLERIGAAANVNLGSLVDPWGRPYLIDENEGENGGCGRDTVAMYRQPFVNGFGVHSTTSIQNVPLSGHTAGC